MPFIYIHYFSFLSTQGHVIYNIYKDHTQSENKVNHKFVWVVV